MASGGVAIQGSNLLVPTCFAEQHQVDGSVLPGLPHGSHGCLREDGQVRCRGGGLGSDGIGKGGSVLEAPWVLLHSVVLVMDPVPFWLPF